MATSSPMSMAELPKPESRVILNISDVLPSTIDAGTRERLCVKFWMSLSKAERKEIVTASEAPARSVHRLPKGSPIDFVSNPVRQVNCWVDASTVPPRIAVLIGDSYATFDWAKGWNGGNMLSNNWAEAVGFELVARAMIAQGYSNIRARLYSDSQVALAAFSGSRVKLKEISESIGRAKSLLAGANIEFDCIKVKSKQNIADAFTRGIYSPGYRRLTCDISLPKELTPLLRVSS